LAKKETGVSKRFPAPPEEMGDKGVVAPGIRKAIESAPGVTGDIKVPATVVGHGARGIPVGSAKLASPEGIPRPIEEMHHAVA